MDYFAAFPTVLPLCLQTVHTPKLAPPALHTGQLTPSADLTVGQPQGVLTPIPSWPHEAVLSPITSWPHEAVLSPIFYPENQGLEKLSDLQVSCGVRCKPRSSKAKSSGLSMAVQLPLEN